jgi:hypothetical protein
MEISKTDLLSIKDQNIEVFLADFLTHIETVFSQNTNISQNDKLTYIHERLTEYSVLLSHKLFPIIKSYFDVKYNKDLNDIFAVISASPSDDDVISEKYKRCFNKFIDSADASFVTLNTSLLGQVHIKDVYILSFFAFLTVKRTVNDNMLQLLLTGASSSGKSTLFENGLRTTSHSLATEDGVGRFKTGGANCLMLNDCDLKVLYAGKDKDRLKSLARTEVVQTKVYASVSQVPAIFLFVTSNMKLNKHIFKSGTLPKIYDSDVVINNIHEEHVTAIKMRFIECFVRKRPFISEDDLLQSGCFSREHCIVGLYSRIVDILKKYSRDDFKSAYLFLYGLSGICKNVNLLARHNHDYFTDIQHLMEKYKLSVVEKEQLCVNLASNNGDTVGQRGACSPFE